jgi:hypothetical protein
MLAAFACSCPALVLHESLFDLHSAALACMSPCAEILSIAGKAAWTELTSLHTMKVPELRSLRRRRIKPASFKKPDV